MLDTIKVEKGDYIDIPIAQGRVIPVVVKTLIFGK
ncbi:MAG: ethanolamine ammonia-lyase reactivating factor EutA [Treponema sp.]|nr:ethanolamine ammonia-lyase reactivating factor EutA [Treponema sp.]